MIIGEGRGLSPTPAYNYFIKYCILSLSCSEGGDKQNRQHSHHTVLCTAKVQYAYQETLKTTVQYCFLTLNPIILKEHSRACRMPFRIEKSGYTFLNLNHLLKYSKTSELFRANHHSVKNIKTTLLQYCTVHIQCSAH